MGGLGNQLFQIFAILAYALKTENSIIFPYTDKAIGKFTERKIYWETFLSSIKILARKVIPKMEKIEEMSFEYIPIPQIDKNKDFIFFGYYQSYKYFEERYDTICKMIRLEQQKNFIKNKYSQYDFVNTVSMHFRIGDFELVKEKHPILEYSYYESALKTIIENNPNVNSILYFNEKKDIVKVHEIILKLMKEFDKIIFICVNNVEEDWEEMLLMSICEHNIIANSTFSWWSAYFNDNPNKMVCYPSIWFGPKLSKNNTDDLCPPNWTKIIC
jgi:hypothetical protein